MFARPVTYTVPPWSHPPPCCDPPRLQRVSPVSHGVCNVVKRVVIIFSSVLFFNQVGEAGRQAEPGRSIGGACSCAGAARLRCAARQLLPRGRPPPPGSGVG
jgi:hypothetical protein